MAVRCAAGEHSPRDCPIARVARDCETRALALARALADTSVAPE